MKYRSPIRTKFILCEELLLILILIFSIESSSAERISNEKTEKIFDVFSTTIKNREIQLTDTLYFDKKIHFTIQMAEKIQKSYFYLSEKQGLVALDAGSYKGITQSQSIIFDYWVKTIDGLEFIYTTTAQNEHYSYSTPSEQSILQLPDIEYLIFENHIIDRIPRTFKNDSKSFKIDFFTNNSKVFIDLIKDPELPYNTLYIDKILGLGGIGYTAGQDSAMYLIQSYELINQKIFINKIEPTTFKILGTSYSPIASISNEKASSNDSTHKNIPKEIEIQEEITEENDKTLKFYYVQRERIAGDINDKFGIELTDFLEPSKIGEPLTATNFSDLVIDLCIMDLMINRRKTEIVTFKMENDSQEKTQLIKDMFCILQKREALLKLKKDIEDLSSQYAKKKNELIKTRRSLIDKFQDRINFIEPFCIHF